jgi:AcrR family transcriptional regulator
MNNQSTGIKSDTRTRILETAKQLFINQGYHGTSMRQISDGADIALGGLYNHFDSKASVFEEVFYAYHPYHEILPAITRAEGENVEELVRCAVEKILETIGGRPDFINLLFIEVVEFDSQHTTELAARLIPTQLTSINHLLEKEKNRLRPIPPLMLIRGFMGMIFAYLITEIVMAENAPAQFRENASNHMVDMFLHGILQDDKG